jgi:hypothetical protein
MPAFAVGACRRNLLSPPRSSHSSLATGLLNPIFCCHFLYCCHCCWVRECLAQQKAAAAAAGHAKPAGQLEKMLRWHPNIPSHLLFLHLLFLLIRFFPPPPSPHCLNNLCVPNANESKIGAASLPSLLCHPPVPSSPRASPLVGFFWVSFLQMTPLGHTPELHVDLWTLCGLSPATAAPYLWLQHQKSQ